MRFTTHTPVAAGNDRLRFEMAMRVLGRHELIAMKDVFCCDNALNMTYLALSQPLSQRRRQKTPRSLSPHVGGLRNRRDHKRHPCADLDIARLPVALRALHSQLARGQRQLALCGQHPAAKGVGCARSR